MQLLTLFLVLALAATSGVLCVDIQYKDCGSKLGEIVSLDVTPCDNPSFCALKRGMEHTMKITFVPSKDITAVKATVIGIIRGIPIPYPVPDTVPCHAMAPACPLKAGSQVVYSLTVPVKTEYPPLVVVFKLELADQDGNNIVCSMNKVRIV